MSKDQTIQELIDLVKSNKNNAGISQEDLDSLYRLCASISSEDVNTPIDPLTGKTLLHLAAEYNAKQMLRAFIFKGAELDKPDLNDNTAVHYAVNQYHSGNFDIINYVIQELYDQGCKFDIKNNAGQTPIDVAKAKGGEILGYLKAAHIFKDSFFETKFNFTRDKIKTFTLNTVRRVILGFCANYLLNKISPFLGNLFENKAVRYGISYVLSCAAGYFLENKDIKIKGFAGKVLNPLVGGSNRKDEAEKLINDKNYSKHRDQILEKNNQTNFVDCIAGTRALRSVYNYNA